MQFTECFNVPPYLWHMFPAAAIFWILVGLVAYTYLGYGLLLRLFRRRTSSPKAEARLPVIAHIIAAYNEEPFMARKIGNALEMDYPKDLLHTVVVADGSTDQTGQIAGSFPRVQVLHHPLREGKAAAINRGVAAAPDAEVLVFSDANTLLNREAFRTMVNHYADPQVGGVAGEKRISADGQLTGEAEAIYWRYESLLKQLESDFHTVVGAAGELFSLRRSLFVPIPEHVLLDDLYLSLQLCRKGARLVYEPNAFATEAPSISVTEERKRRVRISAGAFQALSIFRDLLSIPRYGKLGFQFLSHRVMRWTICPLALPIIFLLNILLLGQGPLYTLLLCAQILFYLFALIGSGMVRKGSGSYLFLLPFYFTFMNLSILAGLKRYLSGTQRVTWEKSKRAVLR
jgi:biofilm PGA synthesis N-glycosyltransferase PgaC